MELHDGDLTFTKSFTRIGFLPQGGRVAERFSAPKGREFVVLLLGTIPSGSTEVDAIAMLEQLGFTESGKGGGHG